LAPTVGSQRLPVSDPMIWPRMPAMVEGPSGPSADQMP